jgi:hypothetical protein
MVVFVSIVLLQRGQGSVATRAIMLQTMRFDQ